MNKVAPLPGTFMITSIIGFLLSALYIFEWSVTWGFTFCFVFTLMFIASLISMSKADAEAEIDLDNLAFHTGKEE